MFYIAVKENQKFSVKNERGEWWTKDGWVSPNSSWWQIDPNCWNIEFSFFELCEFLKEKFHFIMPGFQNIEQE